MPLDFDSLTKFLQSPPGQLATGTVLGGIVIAWFKRVGDLLRDDTNKEIARWIKVRGVETALVADDAENWPGTFAKVFDRVFGEKHLSWKCFWRSCVASSVAFVIAYVAGYLLTQRTPGHVLEGLFYVLPYALIATLLPDYLSLLESRTLLPFMDFSKSTLRSCLLVVADALVTGYIGWITHLVARQLPIEASITDPQLVALIADLGLQHLGLVNIFYSYYDAARFIALDPIAASKWLLINGEFPYCLMAAFFTSIWLWLYAASGFALKAARRFDLGFQWFNSHFDIDKKPLQAMGILAGAIVAVVYWIVALGWYLVK